MRNFKIFTESKADIKFIKDYCSEIFGTTLMDKIDFDDLNGWSGYKTGGVVKASIQQANFNNQQIVLILDADNNFEQRRNDVLKDFKNYEIPVQLFLFPNHHDNRCLENLCCNIAVHKEILACFENYENCIVGYQKPILKSKVYAYLDALLPEKDKINLKEENRNYREQDHWDLKHQYLQPLHDFLSRFL